MGYKDKEKQKQVQRDWVRQKRIDKKGSTKQGSTIVKPSLSVSRSIGPEDLLKPTDNKLVAKHKGVTSEGVTDKALPDDSDGMKRWRAAMNKPKRGKDIKCITIGDQARSMKTMAMLASTVSQAEPDSYYAKHKAVKAQSYNPMMVGYVPPKR